MWWGEGVSEIWYGEGGYRKFDIRLRNFKLPVFCNIRKSEGKNNDLKTQYIFITSFHFVGRGQNI